MALKPNSLSIGQANDRDKAALAEQAYRLTLGPKTVNGRSQRRSRTLLRSADSASTDSAVGRASLASRGERLWTGLIFNCGPFIGRCHHLERLDVLKQAVRQAAFFKINGFAIKLEGHFQYKRRSGHG